MTTTRVRNPRHPSVIHCVEVNTYTTGYYDNECDTYVYTTFDRMQAMLALGREVTTRLVSDCDEWFVETTVTKYTYAGTTNCVPADADDYYDDNRCGVDYFNCSYYDDLVHTCALPPRKLAS